MRMFAVCPRDDSDCSCLSSSEVRPVRPALLGMHQVQREGARHVVGAEKLLKWTGAASRPAQYTWRPWAPTQHLARFACPHVALTGQSPGLPGPLSLCVSSGTVWQVSRLYHENQAIESSESSQ